MLYRPEKNGEQNDQNNEDVFIHAFHQVQFGGYDWTLRRRKYGKGSRYRPIPALKCRKEGNNEGKVQ